MLADRAGAADGLVQLFGRSIELMLVGGPCATGFVTSGASSVKAKTPRPPESAAASRRRSGGRRGCSGAVLFSMGTSSVRPEC
jgi:hypothetical protein